MIVVERDPAESRVVNWEDSGRLAITRWECAINKRIDSSNPQSNPRTQRRGRCDCDSRAYIRERSVKDNLSLSLSLSLSLISWSFLISFAGALPLNEAEPLEIKACN